jgi:hypothetical protein
MEDGKELRVPLSRAALALLEEMAGAKLDNEPLIFP